MSSEQHIPQEGLPEDKLMAYLEGSLSPEERREVELWLGEEGMESDAIEGLQQLKLEETRQLAAQLNYKLQNELRKPRRKRNGYFADNKWSWIAVLIILLFAVLGYVVFRLAL